jgi:hypothetical protein
MFSKFRFWGTAGLRPPPPWGAPLASWSSTFSRQWLWMLRLSTRTDVSVKPAASILMPLSHMGNHVCAQNRVSWTPNLDARSMTAPPPVLLPSSILPPPSSQCIFILETKTTARIWKNYYLDFFLFWVALSLKLRKLQTALTRVSAQPVEQCLYKS